VSEQAEARESIAGNDVNKAFLDYYRCPESFVNFALTGRLSETPGFFRFGQNVLHGSTAAGLLTSQPRPEPVYDALADVVLDRDAQVGLPFDPTAVVDNLRLERYLPHAYNGLATIPQERTVWHAYRLLRPALPVAIRKHLHRLYLRGWDKLPFPRWPVDRSVDHLLETLFALVLKAHGVDRLPFIWFWPAGAPSCAIVTHDVETMAGRDFCSRLMDLNDATGIKSSFQIVPEQRYPVPPSFLRDLRDRGFEINGHDLNHDGHLFADRVGFRRRAEQINSYGRAFGARGFRAGNLYRNPQWFDALDFSYDMSLPNVAHLDPQRGGCCTVLPFFIGDVLELPLTTTQDYSLFHILNSYSLDLWKRQIALVTAQHGLLSFNVHPDYVIEKRARAVYQALLGHLAQLRADGRVWIALPSDVDQWWRQRSQMKIVEDGPGWRIEGDGSPRARLAFASLVEDRLTFTLEAPK
jgi:hypothetical protein